MLRLGLVINPWAGVGGPAAMKGSDGATAQRAAEAQGVEPQASARARDTFMQLAALMADAGNGSACCSESVADTRVTLVCPSGCMGAGAFIQATGFAVEWLGEPLAGAESTSTTADDTTRLVRTLLPNVDLLVFVGGDGTARDVLDGVRSMPEFSGIPVLGVPAGVKMHSGVFATSPRSAALLLHSLVSGGLVGVTLAEVKDIDEAGLRRGKVGSQTYGELLVPAEGDYLQHVKSGGKEVEALVLLEIAAEIEESFVTAGDVLVVGPGSTCQAIKQNLSNASERDAITLLGFDVIRDGRMLVSDATAADLLRLQEDHPKLKLVLSFSRNQGFLFGRGNQQLGRAFLQRLAITQLTVVSSRSKLNSLEGRPLLVDTGEVALDEKFSGLTQIVGGYQDKLLYLVQPA